MKNGSGTTPIFKPSPNLGRGAISEAAAILASAELSVMRLLGAPIDGIAGSRLSRRLDCPRRS